MRTTPSRIIPVLFCLVALAFPAARSYADDQGCDSLLATTPTLAAQLAGKPQHVFIIVLENESFDRTFRESSDAPYLNCLARERGKLLKNYYAIGHYSLDNYIAMISGQPPNAVTQNDCQYFLDFAEVPNSPVVEGALVGEGCVYPGKVETLANQLDDAHLTWRGYIEGMEHGYEDLQDNNGSCEHPVIGQRDNSQKAKPGHQYASRHNPFVYFHSIIDDPTTCSNDTQLEHLKNDLKAVETTPNLAFIVPDLCDDGHDQHCAGHPPDEKDGLAAADRFLQRWVPLILASPAYQQAGMLIITFDEADLGEKQDDYSSCCNEKPGPNTVSPGRMGPGGGRIGTVVVSPFVNPGIDDVAYNHYSLLKSLETLFHLKYLGYAAQEGLPEFGPDVYDAR